MNRAFLKAISQLLAALALFAATPTFADTSLPRDHGVIVGILDPGTNNAITDVADVRVGHKTVVRWWRAHVAQFRIVLPVDNE